VDEFFTQPQGAAVLKHKVLRDYVPVYARKTGSKTSVVLLDGYAGPGRYDDGSSGSPQLMVETAQKLKGSDVHCMFVEENPRHCERLEALLRELGEHDAEVFPGDVEEHLDFIVRASEGKSLLVFLDPFGLSIPFELLTRTVLRRSRYGRQRQFQPTEVLLNFSLNGIYRSAGRLDSTAENAAAAKANATRLRELDGFLGGAWWHAIWRSKAEDRVKQIFDHYLQQVGATGSGWKTLAVPVADRWDGAPVYYLVLFTQSEQGLWYFHNAVSHGAAALHDFTFVHDPQPKLFMPEVGENWVGQIERNILRLLEQHRSFRLVDRMTQVYGDSLGRAREKHVRKALEHLYDRKQTGSNPRGVRELYGLRVQSAGY
jgi:three-Cys-motif partner protein